MAKPIVMPQVGQDLTEGLLVEWNVKVGDTVKKGDVIALVESEKASFEVEAYEEGTVLSLLYKAGELATVLEPIIFLGEEGESVPQESNEPSPVAAVSTAAAVEPALQSDTTSSSSSSPLARRIAAQNGLDIVEISGTGPNGSVVKRDVENAIEARASAPVVASPTITRPAAAADPISAEAEDTEMPFSRMRQVIADRLLLSKQTIPHFYLMGQADITELQIRRKAHLDITGEKLSLNDIVVHATALTLLEFPQLNALVSTTGTVLKGNVNIGVAVSVDGGLMVPAIENTPLKPVSEVSRLIRDYAASARRGINKSQAKSTFSISNLGMYGVDVLPIINPPEAGILGVGAVKRELREHRGGVHGRDILSLTLAADHRAIDGAYGAKFLQSLRETIETYSDFS
ncbi:MAG: dihydrolipoamide acetyltransferase family protein [Hyphomicrobiales bacterium]